MTDHRPEKKAKRDALGPDPRKAPNINMAWARAMVEELLRCGATRFWIAPGSRSAPLTMAVAEHPGAVSLVHFDERGLAFHALGFASAYRSTAVIICTSGTAVANLFPAVVEASKKKLPLVILTADRPPELRHAGSHQTIDQVNIFGGYVRWQVDLPCPDGLIDPCMVLTTVDQAVHAARSGLSGPVHLNCMFREPLGPNPVPFPALKPSAAFDSWWMSRKPYTTHVYARPQADGDVVETVLQAIKKSRTGIIATGKLSSADDAQAVRMLAEKLGWPLFPDVTSGLRLGNIDPCCIHYFDRLLAGLDAKDLPRPDCILHIGGRMTSKQWYRLVAANRPVPYIMVLGHPLRSDPFHSVTIRVHAAAGPLCSKLAQKLPPGPGRPTALCNRLSGLNSRMHSAIDRATGKVPLAFSEPSICRAVTRLAPLKSALFLSNSLPLRMVDMFGTPAAHPLPVGANRGASGIDGIIASAAGFADAHALPATLIIGDIAFLHDLNSLALAARSRVPLVIVVVNNGGGGIFSLLPIARSSAAFERFFATSHTLSFAHAAAQFGCAYAVPGTIHDFEKAYVSALKKRGGTVIEAVVTRDATVAALRSLEKTVRAIVRTKQKF